MALLRGLHLGNDWKEQILAWPKPPDELARQASECTRLLERLKRAREMYLAGGIDRERYAREQNECKALCWPKSTSVRKSAGKRAGWLAHERSEGERSVRSCAQSRVQHGYVNPGVSYIEGQRGCASSP
jgi:hypothetical protein